MDHKVRKSKSKTVNKALKSKPSKKHVKGPTVLKSKVKKTPPMHPPRLLKNYLKPLDSKSGQGRYADQKIDELTKQAEIEKDASLARMTPGPSRSQIVKMVEEAKSSPSISTRGKDEQLPETPEIPGQETSEQVDEELEVEEPPSETVSVSVLDESIEGEEDEEAEEVEESEPENSSIESKDSVPDVEGGLPKKELKKMKINELKEVQRSIDEEIQFIETENYVLQKSLDRLEIREKEIESNLPTFDYRYPWEKGSAKNSLNKVVKDGCKTNPNSAATEDEAEEQTPQSTAAADDDEENEFDEKGRYKYKPVKIRVEDVINPNSDETFENMTEEDRREALGLIKLIGPVAPQNFDIFRHTYGILVYVSSDEDDDDDESDATSKPNTGDSGATDKSFSVDVDPGLKTNLNTASNSAFESKSRGQSRGPSQGQEGVQNNSVEQSAGTATVIGTDSKISALPLHQAKETEHQRYLTSGKSNAIPDDDDDEDFPGFKILSAQKLPVADKLMYGIKTLEELQNEYSSLERNCQLQETFIQVFIDTHIYGYELVKKFQEEFNELKRNSKLYLTGYYMAEKFRRFVKKTQGQLLAELTKVNMTLSEVSKVKQKVEIQLNRNKEMGESIQLIDYQWLKISINQYTASIEERNFELNDLKLLTTHCFQVLKEWRDKLNKSISNQNRIQDELEARNALMQNFDTEGKKMKNTSQVMNEANKALRRKLRSFRAPNTLDYVKLKVLQYGYKDEAEILGKKIDFIKARLRKYKIKYRKYNLEEVSKEELTQENECWLNEIKNDMAGRGIDYYLETASEEKLNCGGSNHYYGFRRGRNKDFNPLREYSKYKKEEMKEKLLSSNRRSQIFSRTAKYSNILLKVEPLSIYADNYALFFENNL